MNKNKPIFSDKNRLDEIVDFARTKAFDELAEHVEKKLDRMRRENMQVGSVSVGSVKGFSKEEYWLKQGWLGGKHDALPYIINLINNIRERRDAKGQARTGKEEA